MSSFGRKEDAAVCNLQHWRLVHLCQSYDSYFYTHLAHVRVCYVETATQLEDQEAASAF